MHKIEVDGQEYRVRYRHVRVEYDCWYPKILECMKVAYYTGQINLHRCDKYELKGNKFSDIFKDYYLSNLFSAVTICDIEDDNRETVVRGYSFCSVNDQFDKKIGRKIALGRAEKMLKDLLWVEKKSKQENSSCVTAMSPSIKNLLSDSVMDHVT